MDGYRYILEPYKGMKTRYHCPNGCKGKTYTRYLDKLTGGHLPFEYGKCERLNNCGYHLNPYTDGYAKKVWLKERGNETWKEARLDQKAIGSPHQPKDKPVYIPFDIFRQSLARYDQNTFVHYLNHLFGAATALELIKRFFIGTSRHWSDAGATVFWLIDEQMNVVGGQVILFDENGHTKKTMRPDGSKKRYNSWVHTALKMDYEKQDKPLPDWLQKYISGSPKFPCLFGLPQLKNEPLTKPVAIVEAAKTAIIATEYLPQYTWLAVGSLSYLNEDRLRALEQRNITLFPDKGAFEHWAGKIRELSKIANVNISDLLERKATDQGSDLADYLTQFDVGSFL